MKNKWIPTLDSKYKNINTNSWFDMKITKNKKVDIESTNFSRDYLIIRSKKIKLFPDEYQRYILHKWFNSFRRMYNETTKFLSKKLFTKDNKLNTKKNFNLS